MFPAPRSDPEDAACGIADPVIVSSIVPGVDVTPAAELRCETAAALGQWVADVVVPAARQMPERGVLSGIDQGSGYICRRRNNAADGKLSEHSFGNAIDIMAFRFSQGDPVRVEPREREGTMAEAFQRTVRAGSCLYFSTVLGPGTDAAHADHLHLDIKERNGGFRLCQ
ncbi:extensin family protein [Sulfitobacter aestuariivivens]|uniref:extensin-like domain-containing protein n=1 Tax=Sulfitobacter aestuariivivens TaxID=2766981 RepID=UPI00361C994A